MRVVLRIIWRLLAFVGKELVETLRRPGAIVSLILDRSSSWPSSGPDPTASAGSWRRSWWSRASSELPGESTDYQELAGPAPHIAGVVQIGRRPRRACGPVRSTFSW